MKSICTIGRETTKINEPKISNLLGGYTVGLTKNTLNLMDFTERICSHQL